MSTRHRWTPSTIKENGMRRITLWLVSTISALVLLFSYRTSTMGVGGGHTATGSAGSLTGSGSTGSGPTGSGPAGTDGSGGTDSGGSGTSSGSGSTGPGARSGTFDGSVAQTRWGPVQVRITVSGGKITEASAVQAPDGNFRDQRINNYAVPILRQETLQAQSAQIDSVSGATVTSDGYRESLQAAIDAAHLG